MEEMKSEENDKGEMKYLLGKVVGHISLSDKDFSITCYLCDPLNEFGDLSSLRSHIRNEHFATNRIILKSEIYGKNSSLPLKREVIDSENFMGISSGILQDYDSNIGRKQSIENANQAVLSNTVEQKMYNDTLNAESTIKFENCFGSFDLVEIDSKMFFCYQCTTNFKLEKELLHHTCFPIETTSRNFVLKKANEHNKKDLLKIGERERYKCNYCDRSFYTYLRLEKHKKTHAVTSKNTFHCNICAANLESKIRLRNHMLTHSSDRLHICEICSFGFNTLNELKEHVIIHNEQRDFKCDICNTTFETASDLRFHKTLSKCQRAGDNETAAIDSTAHQNSTAVTQYTDTKSDLMYLTDHNTNKTSTDLNCLENINLCISTEGTLIKEEIDSPVGNIEKPQVATCLVKSSQENTENHNLFPYEGTLIKKEIDYSESNIEKPPIAKSLGKSSQENTENHKLFPCELKKHTEILEPTVKNNFRCPYCPATLKTQITLKNHLLTHSGHKDYKCEICSRCFYTNARLKEHIKYHQTQEYYQCNVCNASLKSKVNLANHMLLHTGSRDFKCEECSRSFFTQRRLKDHMKSHETQKADSQRSELTKAYQCNVCSASLKTRRNLKTHMLIHSGHKEFKCETCPQSFYTKSKLKEHMRVHDTEKHFQCTLCAAFLKSKLSLKNHMLLHSGHKDFKCDSCFRSFYTNKKLREHMRSHHFASEDTFCCTICSATLPSEKTLKNHMMTHNNNKPFKCEFCDRTFSTSHQQKDHLVVHTRERNYKCDYCNKAFGIPNALRIHLKKYHGHLLEPNKILVKRIENENKNHNSKDSKNVCSLETCSSDYKMNSQISNEPDLKRFNATDINYESTIIVKQEFLDED